ncbi:hypothetical protein SDJN03_18651, partial [Cucurbita argyrosperma subsp. sororia]
MGRRHETEKREERVEVDSLSCKGSVIERSSFTEWDSSGRMSKFISIVNGGSVNELNMLSRGYCDVKEGIRERAGQEGSHPATLPCSRSRKNLEFRLSFPSSRKENRLVPGCEGEELRFPVDRERREGTSQGNGIVSPRCLVKARSQAMRHRGTGSQGEAKSEDGDKEGNKTKKASAARRERKDISLLSRFTESKKVTGKGREDIDSSTTVGEVKGSSRREGSRSGSSNSALPSKRVKEEEEEERQVEGVNSQSCFAFLGLLQ